eukprot:12929961-Prorocentrum_lima.AAC.1
MEEKTHEVVVRLSYTQTRNVFRWQSSETAHMPRLVSADRPHPEQAFRDWLQKHGSRVDSD